MTIYDRLCDRQTETDLLQIIENFEYLPELDKNIIPFESNIQDIFNLAISASINSYGLKDRLHFTLYEALNDWYRYSVIAYDLPDKKLNALYKTTTFEVTVTNKSVTERKGIFYSRPKEGPASAFSMEVHGGLGIDGKINTSVTQCIMLPTSMIESKIKHKLKGNDAKVF